VCEKIDELVVSVSEQICEVDREMWRGEGKVGDTLYERKKFLNAKENWSWTKKNKKRFVQISDALYRNCQKGWEIAMQKATLLEKQIAEGITFFDDYEVKILITPYTNNLWQASDDIDEDIRGNVSTYMSEECKPCIEMNISHCHYDNCVKESKDDDEIFISKKWNWNTEYLGDYFKNDYICFAMHWLLDSRVWSFGDICSIDRIFVEVEVDYQYCEKVPFIGDLRNENEDK
jgi:hypothetical protein